MGTITVACKNACWPRLSDNSSLSSVDSFDVFNLA